MVLIEAVLIKGVISGNEFREDESKILSWSIQGTAWFLPGFSFVKWDNNHTYPRSCCEVIMYRVLTVMSNIESMI